MLNWLANRFRWSLRCCQRLHPAAKSVLRGHVQINTAACRWNHTSCRSDRRRAAFTALRRLCHSLAAFHVLQSGIVLWYQARDSAHWRLHNTKRLFCFGDSSLKTIADRTESKEASRWWCRPWKIFFSEGNTWSSKFDTIKKTFIMWIYIWRNLWVGWSCKSELKSVVYNVLVLAFWFSDYFFEKRTSRHLRVQCSELYS